jgi:hypothetical protein
VDDTVGEAGATTATPLAEQLVGDPGQPGNREAEDTPMRRGIATFAFLARLALATLAGALTATAMRSLLVSRAAPPAQVAEVEPLPPAPAAPIEFTGVPPITPPVSTSPLHLRGGLLHVPSSWFLDLTGATLTNVTLTGNLAHADVSPGDRHPLSPGDRRTSRPAWRSCGAIEDGPGAGSTRGEGYQLATAAASLPAGSSRHVERCSTAGALADPIRVRSRGRSTGKELAAELGDAVFSFLLGLGLVGSPGRTRVHGETLRQEPLELVDILGTRLWVVAQDGGSPLGVDRFHAPAQRDIFARTRSNRNRRVIRSCWQHSGVEACQ